MDTPYRENLFEELISHLMKLPDRQLKAVAEEAEITYQTLNNWCWGSTMNPHLNTIMKVSRALGYEVQLRKPKRHLKKVS